MSLKYEQYNSLLKTKDLLLDIINPTKELTPAELKERAHSAIRHFPLLMENGEPIFSRDDFKSPYQNKVQTMNTPRFEAIKVNDNFDDVVNVDFDGCKTIPYGGVVGTISVEISQFKLSREIPYIETKTFNFTGEHGLNDYVDRFGFIIKIND